MAPLAPLPCAGHVWDTSGVLRADCWSFPHLIHVVAAVCSLVLFLFLASMFCVGELELDFRSSNRLAMMHTECGRSGAQRLP